MTQTVAADDGHGHRGDPDGSDRSPLSSTASLARLPATGGDLSDAPISDFPFSVVRPDCVGLCAYLRMGSLRSSIECRVEIGSGSFAAMGRSQG